MSSITWLGLAPLVLAPAGWAYGWLTVSLQTNPSERRDWRVPAVLGLMAAAGTIAIIGTLLIYLAQLEDGVESALAVLVWVFLLVEFSPFIVSLLVDRRGAE